ncbi:FtsX-like permease family [Clostridioides difficile]|nr:FtsX-like permease family [Clostridioides difficile]
MLKALGVTKKQIEKIINFEGIIFGVKGGIIGVTISMIFVYSLYYFIKSIEYFKWNMPICVPIISLLIAIIVGYVATIGPLVKVNNINIIDEIKIQS